GWRPRRRPSPRSKSGAQRWPGPDTLGGSGSGCLGARPLSSRGDRSHSEVSTMSLLVAVVALTLAFAHPAHAWEPTKPIELVVPAGTGGGADQMARLISAIADESKLSPRPVLVVNKSGGAGAEGFLHVKGRKGDSHTLVITLSNLFTTPLHTAIPFSWKDLTPVARLALDEFILWVNADTSYKTAKEYLAAVKEQTGKPGQM